MTAVLPLVRASIDLGREVFPDGHGPPTQVVEMDVFEVVSMTPQIEQASL
jgi:hypothetical protein